MNQLQTKPTISIINNQAKTTSLDIARNFEKRHDNVLRDIENLECSKKFAALNFEVTQHLVQAGAAKRNSPYYQITRDGFTFLAMGFTGKKAAMWKERYIEAFNAMEQRLINYKIGSKTCSICGESKPLTDFHKDSRIKSTGRRANCIACGRKRQKELEQIKAVTTPTVTQPEAKRHEAVESYRQYYKMYGAEDTAIEDIDKFAKGVDRLFNNMADYSNKIIASYLDMQQEKYEYKYYKKVYEALARNAEVCMQSRV